MLGPGDLADSVNGSEDREESELIGSNKILLQIAQKEGICAGRDRKLREASLTKEKQI